MFSSTDSAKSALDMSPSTDRSTDINAILSCHVECVSEIQLQKIKKLLTINLVYSLRLL